MGNRYVYLGKRVRDIRPKGLTHAKEVLGIKKAILRDYRAGRISAKKARGRLLLLYRLVRKDRDLRKLSSSTRKKLLGSIKAAMRKIRKRRR